MGIESYGGSCPKCKKAMLQKWESSRMGIMFDACPWCGFAGGTQDGEKIENPEDIWSAIHEAHYPDTKEKIIEELNLDEYVSEADSEFYPSIFEYERENAE